MGRDKTSAGRMPGRRGRGGAGIADRRTYRGTGERTVGQANVPFACPRGDEAAPEPAYRKQLRVEDEDGFAPEALALKAQHQQGQGRGQEGAAADAGGRDEPVSGAEAAMDGLVHGVYELLELVDNGGIRWRGQCGL